MPKTEDEVNWKMWAALAAATTYTLQLKSTLYQRLRRWMPRTMALTGATTMAPAGPMSIPAAMCGTTLTAKVLPPYSSKLRRSAITTRPHRSTTVVGSSVGTCGAAETTTKTATRATATWRAIMAVRGSPVARVRASAPVTERTTRRTRVSAEGAARA